jgi:hypothetical protein
VEQGIALLQRAIEMSDGYATTACEKMARYYELIGDTAAADEYYRKILKNNRLD